MNKLKILLVHICLFNAITLLGQDSTSFANFQSMRRPLFFGPNVYVESRQFLNYGAGLRLGKNTPIFSALNGRRAGMVFTGLIVKYNRGFKEAHEKIEVMAEVHVPEWFIFSIGLSRNWTFIEGNRFSSVRPYLTINVEGFQLIYGYDFYFKEKPDIRRGSLGLSYQILLSR